MAKLLLISNSTQHGGDFLAHCEAQLKSFLQGLQRVLFVPYAGGDLDAYAEKARAAFVRMGMDLDSIHQAADPRQAVSAAQALFIGGGNTFRLLHRLYAEDLLEPIRQKVAAGMPYVGTSAGSNVACLSICTTNDMPIIYPPSFDALGLLPILLNPHYIDPEPGSRHIGETREDRIREFHEVRDEVVVGLREGGMLHLDGQSLQLRGLCGAVVFAKGKERQDHSPGADLSFLLA